MDTNGGIHRFVLTGYCDRLPAIPEIRPDRHDGVNARLLRPANDVIAVLVKLPHFEVGMRVNQHQDLLCRTRRPLFHLNDDLLSIRR